MKNQVCSLLNPPLETGNDWRMLAACLKVDHYLPYFASRPSPTDLVISNFLWITLFNTSNLLNKL